MHHLKVIIKCRILAKVRDVLDYSYAGELDQTKIYTRFLFKRIQFSKFLTIFLRQSFRVHGFFRLQHDLYHTKHSKRNFI